MKYLKEYHNYDNEVAEICDKYHIKNWSIRNGLVDVDGDVDLVGVGLKKIPLKFGRVGGYFDVGSNKLYTLEGTPIEVSHGFRCSGNYLTTMEYAPMEVGGYFGCSNNQLATLEGAPESVGDDFNCSYNKITTLEHFPNVKGDINIDNNPLPKEIYDNQKYLKQIIENGDDYDIWRDGKLYLPRFNQLMLDIREDKK